MEKPTLIITGASRGLGAAVARLAARLGANLVLAARSFDHLEAVAAEIRASGGRALAVRADVSREEDCQAIVQHTLENFGQIDALVNNSGTVEPIAPLAEAGYAAWQYNWQLNVLGPLMLVRMALPYLRLQHGRVVNITSGAAVNIIGGWGAYSAAKVAINHLTGILAAEEPEITALALRPGIVDTEMQATIRAKGRGHMAEGNYEHLSGLHAQGRLLPPETPGRAIACLALHAPHAWSGAILQWDEARLQELVARYGTQLDAGPGIS